MSCGEGCITGTGERKTLRFTTTISNYGNEDFYIGQSGGAGNLNPNFIGMTAMVMLTMRVMRTIDYTITQV